ncbi:MAG: hypothetical protein AAGB06_00530 [Verrucomicrobiota bacterium]
MIQTTILRHPKERLSKCSLEPLRGRAGYLFLKAKAGLEVDVGGKMVLAVDAPPLSREDGQRELVLLDSTWRLLPDLQKCLQGEPVYRSIPGNFETAYPRVSKVGDNPVGGLASVEALYLAIRLMGENRLGILDAYHWRDEFLRINEKRLEMLEV